MTTFLLSNFAIDSAELKPEHEAWLMNAHIEGMFENCEIQIVGYASRSGPAAENEALGLQRAQQVRASFANYDPALITETSSDGETKSPAGDNTECAVDRAVKIIVSPLRQDAAFAEGERVNGRDRDGPLPNGFHLRPCPPNWVLYEREKASPEFRRFMREKGLEEAAAATTNLVALGGASRAGGAAAVEGANLGFASPSAQGGAARNLGIEDPKVRALNERIWTAWLYERARAGYGFDEQYRVIDKFGRVHDTWWQERMR